MTEKEFVEKSLTLSFEFQRYLISHPEIAEKIPKEAQVLFILKDDQEFTERERRLAESLKKEGQSIILVEVEKILPPFTSRLVNPHIELTPAS